MKKLIIILLLLLIASPVKAYTLQNTVDTYQHVLGLSKLTGSELARADVNGDGRVDINDVVLMVKSTLKELSVDIAEINQHGYRGWAVTVCNPQVQTVLAKDRLGGRETTLQASDRLNAVLAFNGGGFNISSDFYPTGNTVVNGSLVTGFTAGTFVGFDHDNNLIGGNLQTEADLWSLNPAHGVSFGPVLIKDGIGQNVNNVDLHPRTAVGQLPNGDLLIIVIDGRQIGWSKGITLLQLRDLFLSYGAVNAYNLDGGGSTTLVYRGQVLNKPSDGQPRVVATNFIIK